MYVMHYTGRDTLRTSHLYEMTPAEFKRAATGNIEESFYRKVSASDAHQHVRRDGVHSTGLWIKEGRIAKA